MWSLCKEKKLNGCKLHLTHRERARLTVRRRTRCEGDLPAPVVFAGCHALGVCADYGAGIIALC